MSDFIELLQSPWPWYVSGPIIGLMVPMFILVGSRSFGISQNLEHICAMTQPRLIRVKFFQYDWRISVWSLVFVTGVILGGFVAGSIFTNPEPIQLSEEALQMFSSWGLSQPIGLNPPEIFNLSAANIFMLVVGGVLIGFGTRYASGCTSGHAITGLATFQVQSLYAVIGIFSGGIVSSYFIVPYLGF